MAVTTTSTPASPAPSSPSEPEPVSLADASASNNSTTTSTSHATSNGANAQAPDQIKRRVRRASTAERRATHNAVERMRRDALNGRFLTLASMLPPLAALRRPSKAAIVGTSIATVKAARRHRVLAAQTLRTLAREAEGLRREVNEWRARARVPHLDVSVRSEAHDAILRAEVEDFDLILEDGLEFEIEEEDLPHDNDSNDISSSPVSQPVIIAGSRARSASTISMPGSAPSSAALYGSASVPIYQQQHGARFAFGAPSPPSPSSTSSASGDWDGPLTPPSSAGMGFHPRALEPMHPSMLMQGYDAAPKGYFDAPTSAGAAYDLGVGFDAEKRLMLGGAAAMGGDIDMGGMGMTGGMGMGWARNSPSHPTFHHQQTAAQHAIRLREVYEQQMAMLGMGSAVGGPMVMQTGGRGGLPMGVAPGQYLHQPTRFV
ncbi:hypothetical protein DFH06DRAFT_1479186 [Mycena polygramma]|nr:hypothetical protein DFH06DRAFT_1479186 [Mycena polygramma]